MNVVRDRRTSVVATITGISIAVAGVLIFTRTDVPGIPPAVPKAAAATNTVPAAGARGPGIPPAPGATQNAPPDANPSAPTSNIHKVADALHLNFKSVTVVVTAPAALGVTNRLDISLRYSNQGQHVTQPYNNSAGNRLVATLPEGDGSKRREQVTINLTELTADGSVKRYALESTLNLEPLYDISLGHFHAYLYDDCDPVGDSEVNINWSSPDGKTRHTEVSMSAGDDVPVPNFAVTFPEVGQSANLELPAFLVWEQDLVAGFHRYPPGVTPLLPGSQTRTLDGVFTAENDNSCRVKLTYRITFTLRQYPNL
jgi:hypothetical protein